MPIRIKHALAAALALAHAIVPQSDSSTAHAINIVLNFDESRSHSPPYDPVRTGPGGQVLPPAGLESLFQYAESFYQGVFEDTHTLTINYWYFQLGTNVYGDHVLVQQSGGRETEANIRIDTLAGSVPRNWYIDPTPESSSEFNMQQQLMGQLSSAERNDWYDGDVDNVPDTFEVGYQGKAIDGGAADGKDDMLSVILHEVGHALGMSSSNNATVAETGDRNYAFNPAWIFGKTIGAETANDTDDQEDKNDVAHLDNEYALMYPYTSEDVRTLPSHTDLFSMAAAHKYTQLDVPRREMYGASWTTNAHWSGNRAPESNDDAFIRHGGSVVLNGTGSVDVLEINGDSRLTIASTGTLNFTSQIVIGNGILRLQGASAINSATGFIEVQGASADATGRLELAGGASFASEPLRLRGRQAINSYLPHVLNVSGNNTWNSPITLYQGASHFSFESAAGTLALSSTATITPGNTTGSRVLNFFGAGNGVASGAILEGNNTWDVDKSGAGTWTFTGSNSYSGGTTIRGGVLSGNSIANNGVNSSFGRGNFAISGGATLRYIGASASTNRSIVLSDLGGRIDVAGGSGVTLTISGVISSSTSSAGLTKLGSGTLRLSGNNTYASLTSVSEGRLQLGASERLANASRLFIDDGAAFDLNNFTETVASLSGGGAVLLGSGSLITGGGNSSTTYAGAISGTGSLTKTGTGVFTLSANNSYSGITTIQAGELHVSGATASIASSGQVRVRNGAKLRRSGGNLVFGTSLVVDSGGAATIAPGFTFINNGSLLNDGAIVADRFQHNGGAATSGAIDIGDWAQIGVNAADTSWLLMTGGTFRTGVDATASDPDLEIGYGGFAGFEQAGGVVEIADEIVLGYQAKGDGILLIDAGATTAQAVLVGRLGAGRVDIAGTGRLTAVEDFTLGRDAGSTGTTIVKARGRLDVGGSLQVGVAGTGALRIDGDGVVDVIDTLTVSSLGSVSLRGGAIRTEAFDHTNGGSFDFTGGRLSVDSFLGDLAVDGGVLAPGSSLGSTSVSGDLLMSSGQLAIEISSLGFDVIQVQGQAAVADRLLVSLLDNYLPTAGSQFEFLTSGGGVTGLFNQVQLPVLPDNLYWGIQYRSNSVVLSVNPYFEADFDSDGDVDGNDLTRWRQGFASSIDWAADADNDNDVDGADFLTWQRQLGAGSPAAMHVPEPGAALLVAVAAIMLSHLWQFSRHLSRRPLA